MKMGRPALKSALMYFFFLLLCSLWCALPQAQAGDTGYQGGDPIVVPPDVARFVPADTYPIELEQGDLNADNVPDYLLVFESKVASASATDDDEHPRSLVILIRMADGTLKQVKRNDKIVYCRTCGGMLGDPFQGIELLKNGFTVSLYGGSAWRWANSYSFKYSQRDKTWQLVKAFESSFHASDPEKTEDKTYVPPKDFGKIDIADFDPLAYLYKDKDN